MCILTDYFFVLLQITIPAINIVIFGAGGVGKTSLIRRYLYNKFTECYTPTVEDDYRKIIECNGNLCDMTILDTAGTYQFPAMRKHAIQHGHGFVVVYAIDDPMSLDEAKRLHREIIKTKGRDEVPIVLVGNKSDKSPLGRRKISNEDGNSVITDWGFCAVHMEASARINHNVKNIFDTVIELIHKQPSYEDINEQSSKLQSNNKPLKAGNRLRRSFRRVRNLMTQCVPRRASVV